LVPGAAAGSGASGSDGLSSAPAIFPDAAGNWPDADGVAIDPASTAINAPWQTAPSGNFRLEFRLAARLAFLCFDVSLNVPKRWSFPLPSHQQRSVPEREFSVEHRMQMRGGLRRPMFGGLSSTACESRFGLSDAPERS
jgi:hypothetical protein